MKGVTMSVFTTIWKTMIYLSKNERGQRLYKSEGMIFGYDLPKSERTGKPEVGDGQKFVRF